MTTTQSRRVSSRRISISEKMKTPLHKPKALFGCRHIQVLLMTGGYFCCYVIRVSMSVAIEAMTDKKSNPDFETFEWSEDNKNVVLSSFFWGYIWTQIPGGLIAQRWGAKRIYGTCMGVCALVTLLVPFAAFHGGWQAVCACRVISGFCQGVVPPILHNLCAKWVPFPERGTLTTFVYAGGWFGNVFALQSSGVLADSLMGWPSVFYFWGIITLIWSILWLCLGKDSPAEHPSLPLDEREYIEVSLGVTETTEPIPTPWKKIFLSGPVWAIVITQSCQVWGFWMLLTKIPNYLSSVFKFNIKENGLISSIPYLTAWILSFPISYYSDMSIRKNFLSVRASRFLCNSIGEILPAIALVALGYVSPDNPVLAISILVIAVATNMSIYCGHHVNHMDLSPNFAGSLMGCTNAVANVCSILAPLIAGLIVQEKENVSQWRSVFSLTAGIYILGAVAFLLFGSTKVQKWNDPSGTSRKDSRIYGIPEAPSCIELAEKLEKEKNNTQREEIR
ncbi:putative inorganic phosphate cotransporter [Leptopilina heterotoma]|uniref:putative inorganic phosphate cotransporter n=1 Tax=Leptopilina heterotoma TaxID=63436 RepID=UPI001CA805CA|nr:putative inorganic phosphate cotransporter [Leptopilina heterotoma]